MAAAQSVVLPAMRRTRPLSIVAHLPENWHDVKVQQGRRKAAANFRIIRREYSTLSASKFYGMNLLARSD